MDEAAALPRLLPTRSLGILAGSARVREAHAFKAHANALYTARRWPDAIRNYVIALWLLDAAKEGRMPPQQLVAPGAPRPTGGAVDLGGPGVERAPWAHLRDARALRSACRLNVAAAALKAGDADLAAAACAAVLDAPAPSPADELKALLRLSRAEALRGDEKAARAAARRLLGAAPPEPVAREARGVLAALGGRPPAPRGAADGGRTAPPPATAFAGAAAAVGQRLPGYLWRSILRCLGDDARSLSAAASGCEALREAATDDGVWAPAARRLGLAVTGFRRPRAAALAALAFRSRRAIGVRAARSDGGSRRPLGGGRLEIVIADAPAAVAAAFALDADGGARIARSGASTRRKARKTKAAWRRFAASVDRPGTVATRRAAGLLAAGASLAPAVVFGEVEDGGDAGVAAAEFRGRVVGTTLLGSYGFAAAPLGAFECLGAWAAAVDGAPSPRAVDLGAALLDGGEALEASFAGAAHAALAAKWTAGLVRGSYAADAEEPRETTCVPAKIDVLHPEDAGYWTACSLAIRTVGARRLPGRAAGAGESRRRLDARLAVRGANGAVACVALAGTAFRGSDGACRVDLRGAGARDAAPPALPRSGPRDRFLAAHDALAKSEGWPPDAATLSRHEAVLVEGDLRGGVLAAVLRLDGGPNANFTFVDGALGLGLQAIEVFSPEELRAARRNVA